jgi:hypothetical protein
LTHRASPSPTPPTPVKISDINFINITGYASGNYEFGNHTVGSLRCSGTCEDVTAVDVNLKWGAPGVNQTEGEYVCTNVASLDQLNFPCQVVPYTGESQGSSLG